MALYTSKGRISDIKEVETGTSKNGYEWQRCNLILEIPGYQGSITKQVFRVSGDEVDKVLQFSIGDHVEVAWAMYAREWDGKWYNNIELIKIKSLDPDPDQEQENLPPADVNIPAPAPAPRQQEVFDQPQESLDPADNPDDLPF